MGRLDNKPSVESMFAGAGGFPTHGGAAAQETPTAKAPPKIAPKAAPAAAPGLIMTAAAEGVTLAEYLATPGWTEELLIEQGLAIRSNAA